MLSFFNYVPKINKENSGLFILLGADNICNITNFLTPHERGIFKRTCQYINEVCREVSVYIVVQGARDFFKPRDSICRCFKKLANVMSDEIKKEPNVIIDTMYLNPEKANDWLEKMFESRKQQQNFFPKMELGILKLYIPREKISLYDYGFIIDPQYEILTKDIECLEIYYPQPWSLRNPNVRNQINNPPGYCNII